MASDTVLLFVKLQNTKKQQGTVLIHEEFAEWLLCFPAL